MNAALSPTVIRVPSLPGSPARYRIEGGALDAAWAGSLRPGRVAWCELAISNVPGEGVPLCSYRGEVWPSAWPALFRSLGHDAGRICLTAAGAALLGASDQLDRALAAMLDAIQRQARSAPKPAGRPS